MKYDLTVSIVVYKNDREILTKAIDSVLCSTGLNFKLYIIDNSPTDEIRLWYQDERIEYIFNNANIGFGAAHNILMRDPEKMGRYHLVLNPDIYFDSHVLKGLVDFMDSNQNVGNVIPKTYYPNGTLCPVCRLLPRPQDWIFRMFIPLKSWRQKITRRFLMSCCDFNKAMNAPSLSGCFMFFRKSVIEEVGLFDEHIFMYGEDTDINRRIHRKYQTLYYPELEIVHYGAEQGHTNPRLIKIQIQSCIYYLNKWGWFFDKERTKMNNEAIRLYFKK